VTTSSVSRAVLALYIDCDAAQRLDALCQLQWFSRQQLEEPGIQVYALQAAGRDSRSDLRNQVLKLKAAEFIAFIDPTIEINWPTLTTIADRLKHASNIDCLTIDEIRANGAGAEIVIEYGLGNPIQTSPQPGTNVCRRPSSSRCFWRTDLVHDIKFEPAQTDDEFSASEYAWSLKAAARCQTAEHFPLKLYRLNEPAVNSH
jgi:hypothetical protein